jgi:hypothetical protein
MAEKATIDLPYRGLVPYTDRDARFFFGRDVERQLIIANLYTARLTILYGMSGVGKSSLLEAGVVHELQQQDDQMVVLFKAWHLRPIEELKHAIAQRLASDQPAHESLPLYQFLRAYTSILRLPLLIVLDQFEEYFLYNTQERSSDPLIPELARAINDADCPAHFLISIREEALARLDRFEGRIASLFDNYLRLDRLNRQQATEAITGPIAVYNQDLPAERQVTLEHGLAEDVLPRVGAGRVLIGQGGRGKVRSSADMPDADKLEIEAPYLQLVMKRLWDEEIAAGSRMLRRSTLRALGGAEHIVLTHLDSTMGKLRTQYRDAAAQMFHYLVTPSGTKIAHTISDLAFYAEISPEQAGAVMDRLAAPDLRIIRSVATSQNAVVRYEIFHDALAPAILDWRARYLTRTLFPKKVIGIAIAVLAGAFVLQFITSLPIIALTLTRGFVFLGLHALVLSHVYNWFARYGRRRLSAYPPINLGAPLGLLLATLWLVTTSWPTNIDANNPLGTIMPVAFLSYLFTIMITLLFGVISFLVIRLTGYATLKLFKQFDLGYYLAYIAICGLIVYLVVLGYLGMLPPFIIRY